MSDNQSGSVWDDKFLLPLLPLGTEKGCADEPSIVLEEKVALDVRGLGRLLGPSHCHREETRKTQPADALLRRYERG